ncbi:hypothetical protein K461DRAFT_267790 [Myriangium duriaei CBS 260.36]|uniref:Uncharacterized protein n=1 Tax=Myriangium duriaei CBS 260.36 TaxID=1168546 RepID=A0A9P4MHF0_9PEZI|nr:hypothetical protein K461DRAFT_267790 [Myriangium duriaei CBS 260.36]
MAPSFERHAICKTRSPKVDKIHRRYRFNLKQAMADTALYRRIRHTLADFRYETKKIVERLHERRNAPLAIVVEERAWAAKCDEYKVLADQLIDQLAAIVPKDEVSKMVVETFRREEIANKKEELTGNVVVWKPVGELNASAFMSSKAQEAQVWILTSAQDAFLRRHPEIPGKALLVDN